tara:strand:+ start:198 stop:584 length:387 start_codon:yes stop_codon:yes gene_type:complete
MIEPKFRWYHYTMISFKMQLAACAVAVGGLFMQIIIYDMLEEDVVVFHDECTVEIGASFQKAGETVIHRGTTTMCDGELRDIGNLEAQYLYEVLTTDRTPVIVCTKTVSEYLNEVVWRCAMDPEGNNT